MKSIKKILLVFVFLFSVLVQGQDEKVPSYFSNQIKLNTLQLETNTVSDFQNRSQEVTSIISLKQIGNENVANIDDKVSYGEHNVLQLGNNNNYQFLNYRSNQTINLGVQQTGNSNSLKIKGTNSLFKNLKITQFGGTKMSIINY